MSKIQMKAVVCSSCVCSMSVRFTVSLGGGGGGGAGVLELFSHTLYSNNNIWRVTSGCGVQHKPRRMTNELSLAHIP